MKEHATTFSSKRVLIRKFGLIAAPLIMLLATLLLLMSPIASQRASAADSAYNYYFPWYDSAWGRTWILTAMPEDAGNNSFDIFLDQQLISGPTFSVNAGNTRPNYFAEMIGGPVKVVAGDGPSMVSERSLFGNSFEEVWGTPYEELSSTYYWPVYDAVAEDGMRNWILVSNPPESGVNITVEVRIKVPAEYGGDVVETIGDLAPGDLITPYFDGLRSGPVIVTAWETNTINSAKVIASQRVLYNGAFNEMPGIPVANLSPFWAWTWYDNKSAGANAWICVGSPANPSLGPVYLLLMAGQSPPEIIGPVPRGDTTILDFPELVMDGPVFVVGCTDGSTVDSCFATPTDVYASQRSVWGSSFSEISGITFAELTSNANWTWYDNQSSGARNWVLMSNINVDPIYAEVKIAGVPRWAGWIDSFGNQTPLFPGIMGGPVEVKAWTTQDMTPGTEAEVFASQRVIWNGYFNEIVGKGM